MKITFTNQELLDTLRKCRDKPPGFPGTSKEKIICGFFYSKEWMYNCWEEITLTNLGKKILEESEKAGTLVFGEYKFHSEPQPDTIQIVDP